MTTQNTIQSRHCGSTKLRSTSFRTAPPNSVNKYKLYTKILCRLRDDVHSSAPASIRLENSVLKNLVAENYEKQFNKLAWEEVTVSLLSKIAQPKNTCKEQQFALTALERMKKITGDSYIWVH